MSREDEIRILDVRIQSAMIDVCQNELLMRVAQDKVDRLTKIRERLLST